MSRNDACSAAGPDRKPPSPASSKSIASRCVGAHLNGLLSATADRRARRFVATARAVALGHQVADAEHHLAIDRAGAAHDLGRALRSTARRRRARRLRRTPRAASRWRRGDRRCASLQSSGTAVDVPSGGVSTIVAPHRSARRRAARGSPSAGSGPKRSVEGIGIATSTASGKRSPVASSNTPLAPSARTISAPSADRQLAMRARQFAIGVGDRPVGGAVAADPHQHLRGSAARRSAGLVRRCRTVGACTCAPLRQAASRDAGATSASRAPPPRRRRVQRGERGSTARGGAVERVERRAEFVAAVVRDAQREAGFAAPRRARCAAGAAAARPSRR